MGNKRNFVYAAIFVVLAALMYMQFRTWRNFDWSTFFSQTGNVSKVRILLGIGWIYLAYVMRAARWSIFLRPVRRTSVGRLIAPTVVGFTGLALLGRAGEMIRPYLIARKENLSFPSQMAVWAVERIFDLGAFALLLSSAIAFAPATRALLHYFRLGGAGTFVLAVAAVAFGILMVWKGDEITLAITGNLSPSLAEMGKIIAFRIREFRMGLNAIHDFVSLAQAVVVSVAMWLMIALAYWEVLHSYGQGPMNIPLTQVPLLMLSSMVGSMIALPGVGGGTQLATIFTLQRVFQTPRELAASCGILLWLVTFAAVIPVGLVLAHRERLSLRQLSEESHHAEEEEAEALPSAPQA